MVASMSDASPPSAEPAGQDSEWMLASCHQLHASSVANGRNGASKRWIDDSASRSALRADVAASGPIAS